MRHRLAQQTERPPAVTLLELLVALSAQRVDEAGDLLVHPAIEIRRRHVIPLFPEHVGLGEERRGLGAPCRELLHDPKRR